MNKTLSYSIIAIVVILLVLQLFFFENMTILFPIVIALSLAASLTDYYLIHLKIKKGIYLKIGSSTNPIWQPLFWFAMGTIWLALGFIDKNSYFSWNGIDFKILIGVANYVNVFTKYNKYDLLLKDNSMIFSGLRNGGMWRFDEITSIQIQQNHITFHKKGMSRSFSFESNEIQAIKTFFANKLSDKLEISE